MKHLKNFNKLDISKNVSKKLDISKNVSKIIKDIKEISYILTDEGHTFYINNNEIIHPNEINIYIDAIGNEAVFDRGFIHGWKKAEFGEELDEFIDRIEKISSDCNFTLKLYHVNHIKLVPNYE